MSDENTFPISLAPPPILRDINIRISFLAQGDEHNITALAATVDGSMLPALAAKMKPGKVVIDITNGFGVQRSLTVSPAELVVLLQQAKQFIEDLPI